MLQRERERIVRLRTPCSSSSGRRHRQPHAKSIKQTCVPFRIGSLHLARGLVELSLPRPASFATSEKPRALATSATACRNTSGLESSKAAERYSQ